MKRNFVLRSALRSIGVMICLVVAMFGSMELRGEKPWAFAVMADGRPSKFKHKDGITGLREDLLAFKKHYVENATKNKPIPEFIIQVGDIDMPYRQTDRITREVLGENFPWVPVLGNHELHPTSIKGMQTVFDKFKKKLGLKNGPAGTERLQYHFIHKNIQFVVVNVYWDGTDTKAGGKKWPWDPSIQRPAYFGNVKKRVKNGKVSYPLDSTIVDANRNWIEKILSGSQTKYKIVAGHEPAWPFLRYEGSALDDHPNARDKFWRMLAKNNVQIYLNGHTHNYSAYQWLGNASPNRWNYKSELMPEATGTWQIDPGATRGTVYTKKRKNVYDRCMLYCKVTDEAIEVEVLLSLISEDGKSWGKWHVPENGTLIHGDKVGRALYKWKIYPDIKRNLPKLK